MTDPLLLALEQVVHTGRHLPRHPRGHVVLKERAANATLTELNIDCRGCGDVFAFTLDARSGNGRHVPLSEHISRAAGVAWNKVCDGIFVWRSGGMIRVLVCELKSSTPHGLDWKEQLWSSSCFVRYLIEIIKQFLGDGLPVPFVVVFHAVAFHGGTRPMGSGKRRTGVSKGTGYPTTALTTPGRMPVRNREYVPLNALCR